MNYAAIFQVGFVLKILVKGPFFSIQKRRALADLLKTLEGFHLMFHKLKKMTFV